MKQRISKIFTVLTLQIWILMCVAVEMCCPGFGIMIKTGIVQRWIRDDLIPPIDPTTGRATCAREHETTCEEEEAYPSLYVEDLVINLQHCGIRLNAPSSNYDYVEKRIKRSIRDSEEYSNGCDTYTSYSCPKVGLTSSGKWRYIVQDTSQGFLQCYKRDACSHAGESCDQSGGIVNRMCKNFNSKAIFFAVDTKSLFSPSSVMEEFIIPTCCKCIIEPSK